MGSSSLNAEVNALGETPNRSRLEFFVLRLEVEVMYAGDQVFWSFQSALDERLVGDHLRRDIRKLASLPGFNLLTHRLKVSLHSIDADQDAVNEPERLRVFGEHWSEVTCDRVAKAHNSTARRPP